MVLSIVDHLLDVFSMENTFEAMHHMQHMFFFVLIVIENIGYTYIPIMIDLTENM